MRFLVKENELIPEHLVSEGEKHLLKRISDIDYIPVRKLQTDFKFNEELQLFLSGRLMIFDEVPFSAADIHEHVRFGYIGYEYGIIKEGEKFVCNRCGNREQRLFAVYPCARCLNSCTYCRKCLMMGRVSQCTPLVKWTGPHPQWNFSNPLKWEGKLSAAQEEASRKIRQAVGERTEVLIWAVCGAGKTEMLFEGIEKGLEQGLRIAVATPRTDVVLELAPRMQKAFPEVPVAALYGGSEDRHTFAPLVVATTHQLIRFKEAFDVMVIDEVDAFPYTAEEILQHAGEKARKKNSALIYLTATPNEKWQKEVRTGKRNSVILPARYHRHPLPIPNFKWCVNWRKELERGRIPTAVFKWFENRLKIGKQALLFFPHIALMEKALPLFQQHDSRIEAVHSEDPERKEKVQRMRDKQTPVLLTTTILERGVTFPNIDVAVVGAEDDTFTESALVQIAGRVGRNPAFPTGDITFFHYGKTRAMVRARNQLLDMNREAKRRGLVD